MMISLAVPVFCLLILFANPDGGLYPPEIVRVNNHMGLDCETKNCRIDKFHRRYTYLLVVLCQVLFLVAFYTLAFSFKRLNREGVSRQARIGFLGNYIIYIIVLVIVWSLQTCSMYLSIYWSAYHQTKILETNKELENDFERIHLVT
jgi:hypothetical protein